MPVLAYDRVRFCGERVAAVAADDEDIAQRALELIEVEYEALPAVFEPLAALQVEDGRVTNLSFGEYKLPTMYDTPPLTTVLVESANGVGPYQIKGIGESPLTPVAPAIANAVADAVGVRIRDLPLTAEKVYRALKDNTPG